MHLVQRNLSFSNKIVSRHVSVVANIDQKRTLASWKDIPGPTSLPFLGPLHHFIPGIGRSATIFFLLLFTMLSSYGELANLQFSEFSDILFKRYGPIVRLNGIIGKPPQLFLMNPDAISQVLRGENSLPIRPSVQSLQYHRKYCSEVFKQFPRNQCAGLITEKGEDWKAFRSKVNPVMMQGDDIKVYSEPLDNVALDMIERLKYLREENGEIQDNFNAEMNKWALESMGVVTLGRRIGCLDPQLKDDSRAQHLIQSVHDILNLSADLDLKPSLWKYYPTKKFKKAMQVYENQTNLCLSFFNRSMADKHANNHLKSTEKGILDKLMEIDRNVALVMACDMLIGGVDTVANTITATLYLLAKNPDKQKKLREEILSQDPRSPYLRACIKESMRLMPVTAGNARQTTREYNLLGYSVPKDMTVIFFHQFLSLQEDQYLRAKEYIPERWTVDKNDPLHYSHAHPFASSPFGFGSRICIGKRIAELEMRVFLKRFFENFQLEWNGPPMKTKTIFINYVLGPFDFVLKDVKK